MPITAMSLPGITFFSFKAFSRPNVVLLLEVSIASGKSLFSKNSLETSYDFSTVKDQFLN